MQKYNYPMNGRRALNSWEKRLLNTLRALELSSGINMLKIQEDYKNQIFTKKSLLILVLFFRLLSENVFKIKQTYINIPSLDYERLKISFGLSTHHKLRDF